MKQFTKKGVTQRLLIIDSSYLLRKRLKKSITIFLLSLPIIGFSQSNGITITGQILDASTSEPISFVSVYLQSETIGTTTNEEGNFTFHLPANKANGTIIISMIGYASLSKGVKDFKPDEKVFLSKTK